MVTGGGNGIGRASAVRFAEEGARVVIADVQEAAAAETLALVVAAGSSGATCVIDAASRLDNDDMAALAIERFGRLDIALTAAGISHGGYKSGDLENEIKTFVDRMEKADTPGRSFLEVDRDDWQRVLDVNLTGTLLAMQSCAARMIDAGNGGRIVTIASIAAKHPDAGPLPYVVSKAGVWMLTKKAARELAPAGIRVNAIGPGFIETNMTQVISLAPEDRRDQLMASIPMGRVGKPIEIANVALFLASDESSYMTGEIIHPDGGYFTE